MSDHFWLTQEQLKRIERYFPLSHGIPRVDGLRVLADRGYDADWFRQALQDKGIEPCIPPKKNRKRRIEYDTTLYKQLHKVENMFGKLKD